jgi:hypothetical protein
LFDEQQEQQDTYESLFRDAAEPTSQPQPQQATVSQEESTQSQSTQLRPTGKSRKGGRQPLNLSAEERRKRLNKQKLDSHHKLNAQKDAQSKTRLSTVEITKKEARAILQEERGLENQHVIEVCVELAEIAAHHHKLPFTSYLFTRGLLLTLKSREENATFDPPEPNSEVQCELSTVKELYALWDYGYWRQPETFEEWLQVRDHAKRDAFFLGRDILGKDFHEVHKDWADYFPRFNPTLKGDYTQEDMKAWLAEQHEVRDYLLLASRNMYKSSFSLVWAICPILCCPDLRLLLVSETQPLSKGFTKALRGYFEVRNKNNPSKFQQLFPEYCIDPDEGTSLQFECPMAHLGLIQPTVAATSMDSAAAGQRCDICMFDDPLSNLTVLNETQRQASVDKIALLKKLIEVGGLSTCLGTPWHIEDAYAVMLKENAEDPEHPLHFAIDPCFTIKPEAKGKTLPMLEEDDVVLRFPERLTWKWCRSEMKASAKNNYRFFRMQNLVEFVPETEQDEKLVFEQHVLNAAVTALSRIPDGDATVLSVDTAWSLSNKADMSSIAALRLFTNMAGEKCIAVLEVRAERLRTQELAEALAEMTHRYNPMIVLVENGPTFETLRTAAAMAGVKYNIQVPLRSVQASNNKNAKFQRIKNLSVLLDQGRLIFAQGEYVTGLFAEAEKLDGAVNIKSKKNDRWDAIAQAAEVYKVAAQIPVKPELSEDEQSSEVTRQIRQHNDLQAYTRMFGTGSPLDTSVPASKWGPQQQNQAPPTQEESQQRKRTVVGGRFATLPHNFRQQGR